MRRVLLIAAGVVGFCTLLGEAQTAQLPSIQLPMRANSIKFAVMGDTGTGDRSQYETAATLLQGKVEFFAALGNHDDQNQRFYKPFNMNGERYHTFKKGSVRFFVLDSNYMDPDQVKWIERELQASGSDWKIPYFHHPLYSSGQHGSQVELRAIIEPMFVKHGVDVVFAGHEHFYERVTPQKGIWYITAGGSAKLRADDIASATGLTAKGFDTDLSFMLIEIDGNEMFFQTISRTGQTVDQGVMTRREVTPVTPTINAAPAAPGAAPKAAPQPPAAAPKKATPPPPARGRGAALLSPLETALTR